MNELDRSVSLDEAAKLLGCSRRKTWNLIQAGELPASKIGHRWSIRQSEVLTYHQKCKLTRNKTPVRSSSQIRITDFCQLLNLSLREFLELQLPTYQDSIFRSAILQRIEPSPASYWSEQ